MGYLKTLLSKDIIVTPFRVNKQFSFSGTPPEFSSNGPSQFNGRNEDYPLRGGKEGTGSLSLVYNSIKQLYYSNHISGSGKVSNVNEPIINPDGTIIGSFYNPNYENNIQSIDELRYFPTTSLNNITVLSIPSKQFGEYIKPGSFIASNSFFTDDGQGNLLFNNDGNYYGNIIYEAGLIIFTGTNGIGGTTNFADPQWESTVTIYETQYKCTIRANEYNYSLNPSLTTTYGSDSILISGSST